MRRTPWLLSGLLLLCGSAALAAPSIVVFDVPPSSALGADEAAFISQLLRGEAQGAAKARGATLAPPSKLPPGCDGGPCAGSAAQAKGGAFAVTGAVVSRGSGTALVLRLFSAEGSELGAREAASPAGIDGLPDSLPMAIRTLFSGLPAAAVSSAPSPRAAPAASEEGTPRPSAPSAAVEEQVQTTSQGKGKVAFWGGVGAIGAGLAFDALAPTSHDHKLGGADFVPVGLYVVGAVALFYSMTR